MVLTSHWDFFSTSHTRAQTHGSNYFDARPHYWAEFHHSFDKRSILISYVPRRHFPGDFRPIGIFFISNYFIANARPGVGATSDPTRGPSQ